MHARTCRCDDQRISPLSSLMRIFLSPGADREQRGRVLPQRQLDHRCPPAFRGTNSTDIPPMSLTPRPDRPLSYLLMPEVSDVTMTLARDSLLATPASQQARTRRVRDVHVAS